MATNNQVFDQIAESWYRVRHWPLLRRELEETAARWGGGKLLNVGCAHGPDFLPFSGSFELWGVDSSPAMLRQAVRFRVRRGLYVNLIAADAISLPFASHTFDWAVSVATYHHIKGGQNRELAFAELRRVLKPGGEAFVTVWNHCQPRFWFRPREQYIAWRLPNRTVYRYYHLFSYRELRQVLIRAGWQIVALFPEKSYRLPVNCLSRNICAVIKNEAT